MFKFSDQVLQTPNFYYVRNPQNSGKELLNLQYLIFRVKKEMDTTDLS